MGMLEKIITAIRGGMREVGETIVDANGTRIFEQEIKDAENKLNEAKRDLTGVLAKEIQAGREIERLTKEIEKHESYAVQALEKGDEALALDVSGKIADLTNELGIQTQAKERFSQHGIRLKEMIKKTGHALAEMNRQVVMVKTTESVQKATAAITNNYASSNSRLITAKESLDRIQKRQQDTEDRMQAGESLQAELSGQDLEEKLRAAGIGENKDAASDILAKLKAKQTRGGN